MNLRELREDLFLVIRIRDERYLKLLIVKPDVTHCSMDEKTEDMEEMRVHSDFPLGGTRRLISKISYISGWTT